jgi:hypothetical protein
MYKKASRVQETRHMSAVAYPHGFRVTPLFYEKDRIVREELQTLTPLPATGFYCTLLHDTKFLAILEAHG